MMSTTTLHSSTAGNAVSTKGRPTTDAVEPQRIISNICEERERERARERERENSIFLFSKDCSYVHLGLSNN